MPRSKKLTTINEDFDILISGHEKSVSMAKAIFTDLKALKKLYQKLTIQSTKKSR